jgi:hypothetical protein
MLCIRNLFLKVVKMYPFLEDITISSIRNKVYRAMFLKPDTVDIPQREGIAWEMGNQSMFFNCWRIIVSDDKQYTSCL